MASDDKYEDVFEEGDVPKEAQTVHRIRANSTIMQLNKILGQFIIPLLAFLKFLRRWSPSPTKLEGKGGEGRGGEGRGSCVR